MGSYHTYIEERGVQYNIAVIADEGVRLPLDNILHAGHRNTIRGLACQILEETAYNTALEVLLIAYSQQMLYKLRIINVRHHEANGMFEALFAH